MRPLKLRIKNIGPFIDETIDFEDVDNMFIITGNTGAGKTFIFDAITYALYGKLMGNRSEKQVEIKSRYAASDETEFFIDFTFQIVNTVYRVVRNLSFIKPGNKTPTDEKVSLMQKRPGETEFTYLSSNKQTLTNINAQIKDIIGLTAEEFSKIILLPQGAFAEFLKQNSNERRQTLRKLFPVEDYEKLIEAAKAENDFYDKQIKAVQTVISAEFEALKQSGVDYENAEEKLAEMEAEIENLQNKENQFINTKTENSGKKASLEHDLQDAQQNEKNLAKLEELRKGEAENKKLEKKLTEAEKANTFKVFISAKNSAKLRTETLAEELIALKQKYDQTSITLKDLESKTAEMKKLEEKNLTSKTELDSLAEKLQKVNSYKQTLEEEKTASKEKTAAEKQKESLELKIKEIENPLNGKRIEDLIQENQNNLVELLKKESEQKNRKADAEKRDEFLKDAEKLEEKISGFIKEKSEKEEKLKKIENTLDAKKREVEEFKIKNTAFSLSKLLTAGSPCPVCGSTEHPCPAEITGELVSPEEDIEIYEEKVDSTKKELNTVEVSLKTSTAEKERIQNELNKYAALEETAIICDELENLQSEYKNAETRKISLAEMQTNLNKTKEELETASVSFTEADKIFSEIQTKRKLLEKDLGENADSLQDRYDELLTEYDQSVKTVQNWTDNLNKTRTEYSSAETALTQGTKTLESAKKEYKAAEENLEAHLSKSDFETAEKAEQCMMEISDIAIQRKKCQSFNEELHSLTETVKNARKLKPEQEIALELETLKNFMQEIEIQFKKNHEELEEKKSLKLTFQNSFEKIKQKNQELRDLEEKAKPYESLYKHLSGQVTFDTWALGMHFEQIIDFASQRFFEISNNRFEFVLKDAADESGKGYKGLDLQILDHNTPTQKLSETADLSGGETFEASISLALAITDVVQNNNSGIVLDSLFIDEGFGTLDSEPLESVMNVLNELSENKMIGIISHVDSLQNSDSGINSQIYVHKTNHGSTVEVK